MKTREILTTIFLPIVIACLLASVLFGFAYYFGANHQKTRTSAGNYYDYMIVVTEDGHEWNLDGKDYLKFNNNYNGYLPIFANGEKVEITFNTKDTEEIEDDEIIKIEKI